MGTGKYLFTIALLCSCLHTCSVTAEDLGSMMPERCKTGVPSDHKPTGISSKLGDVEIYETVNKSGRVIIAAYDIFAFQANTKQFADILAAEGGFRVVMPDFLRGPLMDPKNFPPKDPTELYKAIGERGTWDKTTRADFIRVLDHFREAENITSFGVYGHCWGGKVAELAATDLPQVKVAALLHPFAIKTEEANAVKAPMYLFPASDDNDLVPFYEILKTKLGDNNCGHRRYEKFYHGFTATRGNFSNPENIAAVEEVIVTMSKFFSSYI